MSTYVSLLVDTCETYLSPNSVEANHLRPTGGGSSANKAKGALDLRHVAVLLGPGANAERLPTPYAFAVATKWPQLRMYTFCAADEVYRDEWVRAVDSRAPRSWKTGS